MRSTNPLMVMSLLLAAARKRLASTIEQCSNIVVLRPGGRLAKPGANSGSILSLSKSPSSNATALITMFNTYPLTVRRSSFEWSRILSASFLEQLMRTAVRRPIADLLSNFFDISNAGCKRYVLLARASCPFSPTKKGSSEATSHKQPPLIESCLGPLA